MEITHRKRFKDRGMRTKEEIYNKYRRFLSAVSKGEALNAIRLIQEEAYNQALKDAAESVRTRTNDESTSIIVDKESILKLKR